MEAMCYHAHGCKPTTAGVSNDDDYEEYEDDDNGNEDDECMFKEN